MLKPFLILVLIAFVTVVQEQTVEREDPELSVVKFSWAIEKQKSSAIRGRGPIGTPISNGRDLGSRKTDMRVLEQKALIHPSKPLGPVISSAWNSRTLVQKSSEAWPGNINPRPGLKITRPNNTSAHWKSNLKKKNYSRYGLHLLPSK